MSAPPFGGILKALGLSIRCGFVEQHKKLVPTLPIIVSMSPPGYPSAWLHPCRWFIEALFHPSASTKLIPSCISSSATGQNSDGKLADDSLQYRYFYSPDISPRFSRNS